MNGSRQYVFAFGKVTQKRPSVHHVKGGSRKIIGLGIMGNYLNTGYIGKESGVDVGGGDSRAGISRGQPASERSGTGA